MDRTQHGAPATVSVVTMCALNRQIKAIEASDINGGVGGPVYSGMCVCVAATCTQQQFCVCVWFPRHCRKLPHLRRPTPSPSAAARVACLPPCGGSAHPGTAGRLCSARFQAGLWCCCCLPLGCCLAVASCCLRQPGTRSAHPRFWLAGGRRLSCTPLHTYAHAHTSMLHLNTCGQCGAYMHDVEALQHPSKCVLAHTTQPEGTQAASHLPQTVLQRLTGAGCSSSRPCRCHAAAALSSHAHAAGPACSQSHLQDKRQSAQHKHPQLQCMPAGCCVPWTPAVSALARRCCTQSTTPAELWVRS